MSQQKRKQRKGRQELLQRSRRDLRCENLETRVFPGSLLLTAFGAAVGAGVRGAATGGESQATQVDSQSAGDTSERSDSSSSLNELLNGLEQRGRERPAYRPASVSPLSEREGADSSGGRDTFQTAFGPLIDFSVDVGLSETNGQSPNEPPEPLLDATPPPREPTAGGGGGGGGGSSSGGGGGGSSRGGPPSAGSPSPAASTGPSAPAPSSAASSAPAAAEEVGTEAEVANTESGPTAAATTTSPENEQRITSESASRLSPAPSAASVPGDFNSSGTVDAADYSIWRDHLGKRSGATASEGDADLDGDVDAFDGETWRSHYGMTATQFATARLTTPGDFNGDASVDAADYSVWRDHEGMTSGATVGQGDGDGDGDVDRADYEVWRANYGSQTSVTSELVDPVASRDDGDWGYIERGIWQNGSLEGGWQGDYRVQAAGTGNESAEWVTILSAGEYEVFSTWVADPSHATDAKYQVIDGATTLATVERDQTVAPIDARFNERSWESLGVYDFSTGVPTVRLSNDASGSVVADGVLFVPRGECAFDSHLTGWRVLEDGGSPLGRGGVDSVDCAAVLSEGDSFRVSLEQTFVVPEGATDLAFRYDALNFDTSDGDFINDAFEVALVDPTGASLVPTYSGDFSHDAFINFTESLDPALGEGTTLDNGVVTLSLAGVAAGTQARLVFRVANNDSDSGTNVTIVDVALPAGATPVAEDFAAKFFVVDTASDEVFRYGSTGNGLGDFAASPQANMARGVASSADGSTVWTIDTETRRVHVQASDGTALGAWRTSGLQTPEGITVVNDDVWVVDAALGQVLFFANAASLRSGEAAPAASFALGAANGSPSDLVTNGETVWVTDDAAAAVFVYGMNGEFSGSWSLDAANDAPSGITLDPSGTVADLWTVDRSDNRVYRYANAQSRLAGQQNAADGFALAPMNASPEGIADPPMQTTYFGFEAEGGFVPTDGLQVDAATTMRLGIKLAFENDSIPVLASPGAPLTGFTSLSGPDTTNSPELVGDFFLTRPDTVAADEPLLLRFDQPVSSVSGSLLDVDSAASESVIFTSNGADGYYNDSIGTRLNGTSNLFPISSDPTINNAPEPDLSAASEVLGSWLTDSPLPLNEQWTLQSIPNRWPVGTETAIVYEIDAGPGGAENVVGDFGVDNGLFVWIDGQYKFGALAGGSFSANEYPNIPLGDLSPGRHYLQVLREDHGTTNGFSIRIRGESIPVESWLVEALDSQEVPLDSVTVTPGSIGGGDGGIVDWGLSLDADLIHAVRVTYTGNKTSGADFGLDNLQWSSLGHEISLTASSSASVAAAGDRVLISGSATISPSTAEARIAQVTVNGSNVDVLDASGRFFALVDVVPGENKLEVVATDTEGESASTFVVIGGDESPLTDFNRYSDITGSFSGVYGRTSFADDSDTLLVELATRNVGGFATDTPLLVGVRDLRLRGSGEASVEVLGTDGVTPDGIPYYDLSDFAADGELAPGETTDSPVISFFNPERAAFDYELVFFGKLNSPPAVTSVPDIEALLDRPYEYQVTANDEDGDPLTYELAVGPAGMTATANGRLTWTPTSEQQGNHPVSVRVSDGRGGFAEQTYTVSAIVPPPNRPPVITSTPETQASVSPSAGFEVSQLDPSDNFQVQYATSTPGPVANWQVREDGSVFQTRNSDTALFLFNQEIPEESQIEGTIQVTSSRDDDHIGFVFGYQSESQYYTFDWSSVRYNRPFGEMRIRRLDGSSEITGDNSMSTSAEGIDTLASKRISWTFRPYDFILNQFDGGFRIQILDQETVLFDETVFDPQFQSGNFGFLNSSQENVLYSGFVTQETAPATYEYDVTATDPDDDKLTYQLIQSPEGMRLNESTGFIEWAPAGYQVGNHDVEVEVIDGRGGRATQEYVVCVKGDPANNAPVFVSQPPSSIATSSEVPVGPFRYEATAVDIDENPVTYQLVDGPEGLGIDSNSGVVTWDVPEDILSRKAFAVSDDAFDGASWADASYNSGGGSVSTAVTSGGNPGPSRRITTSVSRASSTSGNSTIGISRYTAESFDAASLGSILSIGVSQDIRWVSGREQRFGLVLFQNGNSYLAGGGNAGSNPNWVTRKISGLIAEDFFLFDPVEYRSSDEHPDFSPEGGPIQFGYYRSMGNGIGSAGFSGVTDLDNWRVTVTPATSVPVKIAASDGRGGIDEQAFVLEVSQASRIQGNLFHDLNRDSQWQQGSLLLVSTSSRFGRLLFDGESGTFRYPRFGEQPELFVGASQFAENGDLFGVGGGEVRRLSAGSDVFEVIGEVEGLEATGGFALDGKGFAYIGDEVSNDVIKFDLATGETVGVFAQQGDIRSPRDLEYGPDGNLYVLGSLSRTVHRFDGETGQFLGQFSLNPSDFGNWMTFGPDGLLYVSGLAEDWVKRYNPTSGAFIDTFVPAGAQGLDFPGDLTFSPEGDLYVTSRGDDRVLVFDGETGEFLRDLTAPELISPSRVAFTTGVDDEASEPGLSGWTVFVDANRNGRRDEGEISAVTGEGGEYVLENVAAGEQWVVLEGREGWQRTQPAFGTQVVNVVAAESRYRVDFGVAEGTDPTRPTTSPVFSGDTELETPLYEPFVFRPLISDPDGDPLTFALPSGPEGMTVQPQLGTVVWQPREEDLGTHEFTVQVRDDRGGVAVQQFMLRVVEPNSAPTFVSDAPDRAGLDRPLVYDVETLDANGDAVVVQLSDGSPGELVEVGRVGPDGEPLPPRYRFEWTPDAEDLAAGSRNVVLVADDGRGGVSEQEFTLSVVESIPNTAPEVLSSPRLVAYPGLPYTYRVVASDIDRDPLSYRIDAGPAGMSVDDNGVVRWDTAAAATDSTPVRIVVSDGQGGETPQEFVVRVASQDENTAPRVVSNPRLTAREGKLYKLDPIAADDQGDPLVWTLDAAPLGMAIDADSGAIRWTPLEEQVGSHSVTLRVTDAFGESGVQSFVVEVACTNTPPLILSAPVTQASVGEVYSYGIRASDRDRDDLTYSVLSGPASMTVSETGLVLWTPGVEDEGQTRPVVLQVDDGEGGLVLQEYDIEVTAANASNSAPVITTTPVFSVTLGDDYEYFAGASDSDSPSLTFSLPVKPDWLDVESDTGRLFGTPPVSGTVPVVLEVTDGESVATQGFAIEVRENALPEIRSTAPTTATVGGTYRYTVRAVDADTDPLSYSLAGPSGMTIDGFGRVLWSVPLDAAVVAPVDYPASVTVTDPRGGSDTEDFTITVSPDTEAPTVSIRVSVSDVAVGVNDRIDFGGVATVRVTAADNVSVASLALDVNGVAVALDESGLATFAAESLAGITLTARAVDQSGNEGTADRVVRVTDPADRNRPVDPTRTEVPVPTDPTLPTNPGFDPTDNTGPVVEITSPVRDGSVSNLVPVIGTIDDPEDNLWYWRAYTARVDQLDLNQIDLENPNLRLIAEGTNEVLNGEIATFDPTLLTNDAHAILVAAFDVNGAGFVRTTVVNVEGNIKLGEFRLALTDLTVPLAGIPIEVGRVYDSREANVEGDFGYGWELGAQTGRILETVPPGPGDGLFSTGQPFVAGRTKVYVTNPAGQRVGFTYDEVIDTVGFFGVTYKPVFTPDPGVYDTLDAPGTITRGLFGFFDFNPDEYTLTTKEGLKYRYSQADGLRSITDLNANAVTFSKDGIEHSSGVRIDFVRDSRDRIAEVVAPDGSKVLYDYNADGELSLVTTQSGTTSRYTYLDSPNHFLDEGFDARDKRAFKVTYDEDGRYEAIIDALGNPIQQQDYDELADRRATVLDANGNPTELLYNERGNVIEETDAAGNTTFREYSDPANPDLETRIVDRDGNVNEREYDSRGNVLKLTELGSLSDPLENPVVTTFAYNSRNDVTQVTNAKGASTVFGYDGSGNLRSITNAENDTSSFTYDTQGRRESSTDFEGNTTTFAYLGSNSQPSRVTATDGTYQRFAYNQFGQVTLEQYFEADDTLVEQKQTFYDASGRITREVTGVETGDPLHAPIEVRRFYDGDLLDWEVVVNPLSLSDGGVLLESPSTPVEQRLSRITDYEYDAAGNLLAQTDAEGGVARFRYDVAGNRVLLQDPVGNITTWVYDSLDRVGEERDPFYWVDFIDDNSLLPIDELLDAVVAENTLPSGADIDSNQSAEHVRVYGYDGEGNQTKLIDRNGGRREFDFDDSGRLTEERWYAAADHPINPGALVETVVFEYDAVGNMLLTNDSNSNYVFTYNSLNRLRTVDNSDGVAETPDVLLTYEYDAQGNLTKTYDDAGVTVESIYNSRNLLAERYWYDASVPEGEEGDVADARIDFAYNAAGRETRTDRYSDLDGSAAAGHTDTTYDHAGRTDLLRHANAIDELLSSYDYGYDFGGLVSSELRDHQDNQFDQTITYDYDLTGQLLDAVFSGQDDERYRYDANGNRLSASIDAVASDYAPAGPANQLASDGEYRYEYDREGNRVKRVHLLTDETITYRYDHRNRLIAIDFWSSDPGDIHAPNASAHLTKRITYAYDPLGRRVARTLDPDGDGPQNLSSELFIYNGENVWKDASPNGVTASRYLFGNSIDEILAKWRPSEGVAWPLTDILGTARDLAISAGEVINHVTLTTNGSVLSQTNDSYAGRYLYTGREYDADADAYYYRARFRDSGSNSFYSRDPLGFAAGDNNLYRYAANDPIGRLDPTGLTSFVSYVIRVQNVLARNVTSIYALGNTAAWSVFQWGAANLNFASTRLYGFINSPILRRPLVHANRGAFAQTNLFGGQQGMVAFYNRITQFGSRLPSNIASVRPYSASSGWPSIEIRYIRPVEVALKDGRTVQLNGEVIRFFSSGPGLPPP